MKGKRGVYLLFLQLFSRFAIFEIKSMKKISEPERKDN